MSAMEVLTPEQSQVSVTASMSKWFDNIMSQIIEALLLMDCPFQTANCILWQPGLDCCIGLRYDRLAQFAVLNCFCGRRRWYEMTV